MTDRVLTLREPDRATLARQMLLDRELVPIADAVERLVAKRAPRARKAKCVSMRSAHEAALSSTAMPASEGRLAGVKSKRGSRKGHRFKGTGLILTEGSLFDESLAFYLERAVSSRIWVVVLTEVGRALPLTTPAYDLGATEEEVRRRWERYHVAIRWNEAEAPNGE